MRLCGEAEEEGSRASVSLGEKQIGAKAQEGLCLLKMGNLLNVKCFIQIIIEDVKQ